MSIFRKIGYNIAAQIIGKGITSFLGFATIGILTRYLGQEGFGNFNLVFAYLSIFGIFGDLGLQISMVRELTKKEGSENIYGTYFWLKFSLVFIATLSAIILCLFMPYSATLKTAIMVGAIGYGLGLLNNYGVVIFQSKLKLDYVALMEIVVNVFTTVFIMLLVYLKSSLTNIILTIFLGNLAGSLLILFLVNKLVKIKFNFDFGLAKKLLVKSLPIGLISFLSIYYFKIDTIILSFYGQAKAVGIYSLAYGLVENILVIWGYYIASFYPLYAGYQQQNKIKAAHDLWNNSLIIGILTSILVLIVGFVAAPVIINALGGSNFSESVIALRILLFSIPLFYLNNIIYHTLLARNKETVPLIGVALTLLVSIILNLVFIPKYSFQGASSSVIAAQAFLTVYYIFNLD